MSKHLKRLLSIPHPKNFPSASYSVVCLKKKKKNLHKESLIKFQLIPHWRKRQRLLMSKLQKQKNKTKKPVKYHPNDTMLCGKVTLPQTFLLIHS